MSKLFLKKSKVIEEAIRSIYRSDSVSLHAPKFFGNEIEYVTDTINSTFVSSVGKYVVDFENKIAQFTNSKKAVATVNGTSALHLCLKVLDVRRNDYVLTQAFSFIATSNPISYVGANPIFIDISRETLSMCPIKLKFFFKKETYLKNNVCFLKRDNRKISACIPMHTFGIPSEIKEIVEICKSFNVPVIEDCAESLGSTYNGRHTGTFGKIGFFSFNGNKIITTGGGGMIVTDDDELAKNAKHLSVQAKKNHPWKFIHDKIGYNYRMPNINAALGCAQLEKLDYILNEKKMIYDTYLKFFKGSCIKFFELKEDHNSNNWLNSIICDSIEEREFILEYLNSKKIQARPSWELIHSLNLYKNQVVDELDNSCFFNDRIINIPSGLK